MMPENRLRPRLPNRVTKPGIGVFIAVQPEKSALSGLFSALLHSIGSRISRAVTIAHGVFEAPCFPDTSLFKRTYVMSNILFSSSVGG